jgi:hypothetical protein
VDHDEFIGMVLAVTDRATALASMIEQIAY